MGSILLTGGTGYLGSRLAARLAGTGEEVVLLARDPRRVGPGPPSWRPVRGDVLDFDSLREALKGCDRIFHAAAHVRMWDRDPGRFEAINVGGLRNILRAAEERGVSRVVYTSSFIALGPTDGTVADEDWAPPSRKYHNEYERSKVLADQLAREESRRGVPLVILYPGVVYGPGPITAGNLVGRTLEDYLDSRLPGVLGPGDRRFCYAFIEDVVEGHLLAMWKAGDGERYILGGENRTMRELFAELEKLTGLPAPRRRIPYGLAELAGKWQRFRARLTGIEPEITDEVVRIYRREWAYTSRKAEQVLGYRITPLARGLDETLKALREQRG